MRTFRRPPFLTALVAGVAVGVLMWLLPLRPTATAVLPKIDLNTADTSTELLAVSSDGRFLVTVNRRRVVGPAWVFCVWDRHRNLQTPVIEVSAEHGRNSAEQVVFSPDERELAVVGGYDVVVFDLVEGRKIKEFQCGMYVRVFYSRSQLLFVGENIGLTSFDLDTGQQVRRFETEIDGYHHWRNCGEFAVYRSMPRKAQTGSPTAIQVRVYSWITGEMRSEFTEPNSWNHFRAISQNGQILLSQGNVPAAQEQAQMSYESAFNAITRVRRSSAHSGRWVQWLALSPNGEFIAKCGETQRPEWLAKWWSLKKTIDVTRWETDERLARFENTQYACFSRQGNVLAVQHDGGAITLYDFPLRKPWGTIMGAAVAVAIGAWSVGWLWSRIRTQKPSSQFESDRRVSSLPP